MQHKSPTSHTAPAASLQPGTLRVCLLGGLRVTCDDRLVADADWRLSKARGIVKLLALAPGHQLHREYLIEQLWPDLSQSAADNNFHQALHSARRALASALASQPAEPLLRLRQGVLMFDPERQVWIDVDAFAEMCRAAIAADDPATYYSAIELYRGELLPEDRFEEWAAVHRDALQQRFLDLLLRLGRLHEQRRELALSIDVYRRVVALDPVSEDAHGGLMRLYALTGRRQQALRQYERLQDALAEDLDTEPSDAARRLYLDILDERFPARPPVDPPQPLVPPPRPPATTARRATFVDREQELGRLVAFLDHAVGGAGQVVTVGGDPGIGKTWLIEELVDHAHQRRVTALWGRCFEGAVAPAYWPWTQLIRAWVRGRDASEIAATMGVGAGDILRIAPELRHHLPDQADSMAIGADEERFRLFSSIADFLRNATARTPLAVIIDDLHWADRSSLMLLEFLLDEIADNPICIVGAYRDIDIDQKHPLTRILAKLSRSEENRRINLKGLASSDVARMAELASGQAPAAGLATAIHEQTEGNPFFVREIVRLLVDEGRYEQSGEAHSWSFSVPRGVRETIDLRLDRLSADALRLLTVAAVAGREFELSVVARADDAPIERALDLLDEGRDAAILEEFDHEPNQFRFSHALIRQTLYDEASRARRVHLHRRIGEAIERVHAANLDPWLDDLAAHFIACAVGGSVEKGIHYSVEASRQATSRIAYGEAVEHLQRALQLLESRSEIDAKQHVDLLLQLAEALRCDGQTEDARSTLMRAAALAAMAGQHELLARAALGMAAIEEEVSVEDDTAIRLLEQALILLSPGPSVLRASMLASLSKVLQAHDPNSLARRQELSRQAVEMARGFNDPATLAGTLYARLMAIWEPLDLRPSLGDTEEILRLAREAGDSRLSLIMYSWRFSDLLSLGDVAAADRELAAYSTLTQQLRLPYNLWSATLKHGMRALMAGRYAEAEQLAAEAYRIGKHAAPVSAQPVYVIQQFALYRERGGLESLEPIMREILDDNLMSARFSRCLLAILCSAAGRHTDARAEVTRIVGDGLETIPRDIFWPSVMTLLAEAALELDDHDLCQELFRRLEPFSDQIASSGTGLICIGPVAHTLGRLAAAQGNSDLAIGYLERAIQMGRKINAPPFVAWAQHALANVLASSSNPDDRVQATGLLCECEQTARELGMARLLEQIDAGNPRHVHTSPLRNR